MSGFYRGGHCPSKAWLRHHGGVSLRATSLTVAFGPPPKPAVLQDLDFELEAGRFDVIVGANGVGKSTLLRALAGLLPPRGGEVHLDGQPLSELSLAQRARTIGFLPQEIAPAFAYTVEQAVALGARVAGHGHWFGGTQSATDRRAVERALDLVETRHLQDRKLDTLSGGERRRVFIASVLAQEPQVLLLDEPAAMLDLHHQAELFRLLASLADEGLAVACVTHDWNLAVRFADRMTVLKDRGVLACGEPAALSIPEILRQVYGDALELILAPDGRPVVVPR
jgi:iron complex transport system ATP-binding protein